MRHVRSADHQRHRCRWHGADRRIADIAITDGRIVAVGTDLGEAHEIIDAQGLLVTPGFVDVHSHYDGQATWDELLEPSSLHGVTTLVMGNCGVGFAPVKPGTEEWLIQLMEGVEDIPGTALSEGIDFTWESFPEYLDALDERRWSVDVGAQVAHGAVRAYVMGSEARRTKPPTPMTSNRWPRSCDRRSRRAPLVCRPRARSPTRRWTANRCQAPSRPRTNCSRWVVPCATEVGCLRTRPAGTAGLDLVAPMKEVEWMSRLSAETGQPVTFAMLQVPGAPDLWKEQMQASLEARENGAQLYPQVAGRPFGVLVGWQTCHPFMRKPSYQAIAELPIDQRIIELRKPDVRAAILAEDDVEGSGLLIEGLGGLTAGMLDQVFVLGDPPDYEPTPDRSIVGLAERNGVTANEAAYDAFCAEDGRALLMLPLYNYVEHNHDVIREQLTHPTAVSGLADGGAHCGFICDVRPHDDDLALDS